MIGGDGNDTFFIDDIGDLVIELADGGSDRIYSDVDLVAPDNVETVWLNETGALTVTGNDLDNRLGGNSQNNVIDGGLGADSMGGGAGDDVFYVDNAEDTVTEKPGEGTDTIYASASFELAREYTTRCVTCASLKYITVAPADIEFLILTGSAHLRGTGNEIANTIIGNAGNNVLKGAEGDDTLDGGDGEDIAAFSGLRSEYTITLLVGGNVEVSGPDGTDLLINIERLKFSDMTIDAPVGFHQVGTQNDDTLVGADSVVDLLYGLEGSDRLEGLSGNDTLDGGAGDDEMYGGTGDDTYYVDSWGDAVVELAGEGFDRIYASFNIKAYSLRYANIESFALTGAASDLVGNNGVNELIANAAFRSRLDGKGGDDTLIGGAAGDRLDGGLGADDMRGGAGDDFYVVDNIGDRVVELADGGTDEVRAKFDYVLPDNVENLRVSGTATTGTGNALDNLIRASARTAVTLYGLDGADRLYGSAQADMLYGGDGNDVLQGKAGNDCLYGNAGNDTLYGQGGNDRLWGMSGDDVLKGGSGADVLRGDDGNDFLYGDGHDDMLEGRAGADKLFGGLGNDILIGGADRDALEGGAGADMFVFDDGDFAGLRAHNADRITDFKDYQGDKIDLSLVDAIFGGEDDAFTFIADAAFSGTAGELRWEHDGGNTMVYMDTDGDAQADYAIMLDGTLNLAEADFIL
ncbi:calcium-binding protein [Erythrobacter alti]|uniref:calcium-binding protein n=1 Tax=Erythrobacter alti TaxID=1896145 RepID=UPI0030F3C600